MGIGSFLPRIECNVLRNVITVNAESVNVSVFSASFKCSRQVGLQIQSQIDSMRISNFGLAWSDPIPFVRTVIFKKVDLLMLGDELDRRFVIQ